MKIKTIKLQAFMLCMLLLCVSGTIRAQFYSIRTNVAGLATTSLNLEGAMVLNEHWSAHIPIQYNPWTFGGNKKIKNLTFTPGVRYWMSETDGYGYFVGGHGIISRYNVGGLIGSDFRYDGMGFGAGISVGFSIPMRPKWNLEFEVGVGAMSYNQDKYYCPTCGDKINKESGVYFVPSKTAINLVYLF